MKLFYKGDILFDSFEKRISPDKNIAKAKEILKITFHLLNGGTIAARPQNTIA